MEGGAGIMRIVLWLFRLGLAGVFIYAGVMKLADPAAFAREIDAYRLTPKVLNDMVAVYLPWVEVLSGAALLLPRAVRAAASIQMGMLVVFIAALASAWIRGLDISCGCFGASAEVASYGWLIARNIVLLLSAGFICWGIRQDRIPRA